ncbi:lysoplasmalogenase [Paenibacillus sp. HJL G12]|uniref:Lysoplasmalogenase n=1 Tax=Paenibacillus dendrobii TaxID=2691084 RepID=A0A7X3LFL7_9BACL|nr:lysoplasmalogenase [Paenibacillus dendrobii]MWV43806.1 lysoplasmalogenase [Paenibacillus dendrobii]
MLKRLLPAAILIMGLLYIFLLHSLLFKLIPMGLILIYAYLRVPAAKKRYALLTLSGLFFCMLGDGLLHWFLIGLSAFLIGHLFYLSAFAARWRFSRIRFLSIVPITVFAGFMGWRLLQGLQNGGNEGMAFPVILYLIVISLMGFFAIMSGSLPAICGALLFIASDSILSWNMFISGIEYSGVWIMTTYYAAQFLIASSIGYQSALLPGVKSGNS